MENEQQNATALESANQEAIRLGREFLDGIEQNLREYLRMNLKNQQLHLN